MGGLKPPGWGRKFPILGPTHGALWKSLFPKVSIVSCSYLYLFLGRRGSCGPPPPGDGAFYRKLPILGRRKISLIPLPHLSPECPRPFSQIFSLPFDPYFTPSPPSLSRASLFFLAAGVKGGIGPFSPVGWGVITVRVWRRPGEGGGGKVVSKKKILKTRLIFCSPKIHLSFCFQRIFSAPSIPLPTTH